MIAITAWCTFLRTGERFPFPFTERFPGRPADFEPPFGTEEEIPDLLTAASFMVGVPAPGFKLEHSPVAVFEYRGLSIGRLLGSLVASICFHSAVHHLPGSPGFVFLPAKTVQTARTVDRNRVFVQVHSPACQIELVRPRVPGVSVSGIPVPVPVVVTPFFVVRAIGRGTQPTVVVESGRR